MLGASGGALRGLVDIYNRVLEWQTDRRSFRQAPADRQGAEPPRLGQYFDPVADPIATGIHTALGAGVAVLFGTTGQISGAYAAFVVGVSAPALLAQLGRFQAVGNAVAPAPQPVAAEATAAEPGSEVAAHAPPAPQVGLSPEPPAQPEPLQQPADPRPDHSLRRSAPVNPSEEAPGRYRRPVAGEEETA
ncbi:hypothetical protein [Streptomyces phytophilus]|uniref:hypothetical protein n=1 Tax=Streptomyces phytophilus TaxID=722715 RepID=UPI001C6935DB|nr:hypothetical protein [Streptomyces phytophilus]